MKKLIFAILVASATTAFAQQEPQFQRIKMDIYCGDSSAVQSITNKFGEQGFINFKSERQVGTAFEEFRGIVFVNPKTGSFTMVEKITDDVYCVIAAGDKLEPHVSK